MIKEIGINDKICLVKLGSEHNQHGFSWRNDQNFPISASLIFCPNRLKLCTAYSARLLKKAVFALIRFIHSLVACSHSHVCVSSWHFGDFVFQT